MEKKKNPIVFISYTHDNEEHLDKVLNFSNKLRSQGVDAILDQYEESPPEGWPRWMDRQVHRADYVIMVCTPLYFKRVMGLEEPGKGLGGIWEGQLIYQHLYNDGGINNKFIPVLFNDSGSYKDIPTPMQSATHYVLDSEKSYDRLYWRLRGISNAAVKPDLGELRPLEEKERKTAFVTSLIDVKLWDKAKWKACAYLVEKNSSELPRLALIFEDRKYAHKIAEQFKNDLADDQLNDRYEELRIAIIDTDLNPLGYFVTISTNIKAMLKRFEDIGVDPEDTKDPLVYSISRNHYMPLNNPVYRKMFFKDYKKYGKYELLIGYLEQGKLEFIKDFRLIKNKIEHRHISEVKENDLDGAILPLYREMKSQ